MVFADNYSLTSWYSLLGQITITADNSGASTTNWFINQGLLYASQNAVGTFKYINFDIEDRPVYVTDANGVMVTNTFDNLGRMLTRGYPDTSVEKFGVDAIA